MPDQPADATPPSPLDPFMGAFLRRVGVYQGGYAPTSHGPAVAEALDWPAAFADAVFTSARARGLVEPHRGRGGRARNRWRVSARGRAWLEHRRRATDETDA